MQSRQDRGKHALHIPHHISVGDVDNPIPLRLERDVPSPIGLGLMRLSVDFHHERLRGAQEVGNERRNHGLPSKFEAAELRIW
jgi:hypothetical protein